jgi:hypothetical protein
VEEEHRRILREALIGTSKKKPSFKEFLLSMPAVGEDKDFEDTGVTFLNPFSEPR